MSLREDNQVNSVIPFYHAVTERVGFYAPLYVANKLRSTLNHDLFRNNISWLWKWRRVICATGFVFYLSDVIVGTYLSSEHTTRSHMLSQPGGKSTESILPCRDFGHRSWQEGHVLYSDNQVVLCFCSEITDNYLVQLSKIFAKK